MATTLEEPPAPITLAPLPFSSRLNSAIRLWLMKIMVKIFVTISLLVKPPPPSERPTYIKTYAVRPNIKNRVFIPHSYQTGGKPLPLYIDIHGGGFALFEPRIDDEYCSYMARHHGICVVSIGYRHAPRYRFPTQPMDCAALAQAVLDDPDLPCDKSRVVIGGFSAGGNLSLAVSQMDGLRGRVKAVVAYYPVVDFSRSGPRKLKNRPATPGVKDPLEKSGAWMEWGYIAPGTKRMDPTLSPIFAKREDLPPNICLMGCEYDMLREEAEDMAEQLAKEEPGEKKTLKIGEGWETENGKIRWEKISGQYHGFDQVPVNFDKPAEAARVQRANELYDAVAEWLYRTVYV
ncbi:hypothetical protein MMC26_003147 [Xylographa opegraphella]|nr:hypothetical protein [Xylographa opegraphella]